jgi:hypothetical protein
MVAKDAKEMLDFWRMKRNETMARLSGDSINGVHTEAATLRAYKPKKPNLVPKHPPDVEYSYGDRKIPILAAEKGINNMFLLLACDGPMERGGSC